MTDISSQRMHADPQLTSAASLPATPVLPNGDLHNGDLPNGDLPNGGDAVDDSIRCLCGFSVDDGSSVLCEKCNTWQHIACYYESLVVPEIHECVDCSPRLLDVKGAKERQLQRIRELNIAEERRVKRPASKSHKKKVKDTASSTVAGGTTIINNSNGWPLDKNDPHYNTDRKSGSPRDQPPAKRPKTSHKSSASVSALNNGPVLPPNRKRAHSNAANGLSPTKSPTSAFSSNGYSAEYFSPEFFQLYRKAEPKFMQENSYSDIGLTNDLANWLGDPETLADVTEGMQPQQVFSRVPGSIEDLEQNAPVIIKNVVEDQSISANGLYPVWHSLTVDSQVPQNAYIGELTGHVCRKKDYCSAASNRWQDLRHPEPFVFFPPHLPLVIDARKGGTIMRYARRSCNPNITMRIFITDGIYHFCFVATRDIEPGQELTIPWDVDPDIKRLLSNVIINGNIHKEGIRGVEQVSHWVAGVLSNFGGCACNRPKGDCLLERADRRNNTYLPDLAVQPLKASKSRRVKKQQVSPLSTGHATNSRAGSEVIRAADQDEDNADTRSLSGSTRSKPGSRDITPMTHVSNDPAIGLGVELSDREKRKLMQSERLFEQLEYDEQHGHKRKKRPSAGSTLNTPSVTTSKQLGHSDPANGSSVTKHRLVANGQRANGRSINRTMKPPQKPRPVYAEASTQTDDDPTVGPLSNPNFVRRNRVPYFRQLLNRARDERLRREAQIQSRLGKDSSCQANGSLPSTPPPSKQDAISLPLAPNENRKSEQDQASPPAPSKSEPESRDVEMKDVETKEVEMTGGEETAASQPPLDFRKPVSPTKLGISTENPTQDSHPPIQPPAPPWPSMTSHLVSPSEPPSKPGNLHVELPPPPDFSVTQFSSATQTTTPNSAASATGPFTGQSMAQSPSTATAQSPSPFTPHAPLFSPAVASAVAPTPMSKRLSLSDYMARQKAKKQEAQQAQAQAAQTESSEGPTAAMTSMQLVDTNAGSPVTDVSHVPSKDVEMKDSAVDTEPSSTLPTEEHNTPPPLPVISTATT